MNKKTSLLENFLKEKGEKENFFVCDILDVVLKGDTASMEHPIFSLSTKQNKQIRYYTHNGQWLEIVPSVKGLPTVYDRDILIFCISQIVAAFNKKNTIHKTLRFKAHHLLISINRHTNGQAYEDLKIALERLRGTTITTNIVTGGIKQFEVFGLIERARFIYNSKYKISNIEITISDWILNAIKNNEILTLNKNYFNLRRPLEKRLYELARKHCGKQLEWKVSLDILHTKTGSLSSLKEFKRLIIKIIDNNTIYKHIPDYLFQIEENILIVKPKNKFIMNYINNFSL